MRAVLDTNVLVAALRSRQGASFQLARMIRARRLIPIVSTPLCFEYEDVLSRPGLLTPSQIAASGPFLDAFMSRAELREVHFLWRPLLSDPKDEKLVELVMAAGMAPLITFNTRDFLPAVRRLGLRLLTPAEALGMLESTPS